MVFLSLSSLVRARGPDEFWRKRKIFRIASHFIGRKRNCYSIAIRNVHRALIYTTRGRQLKKDDMREIWELRSDAAAQEHGIDFLNLQEGLLRCNILLNRKSLADLAVWEPKSFKSLVDIACARVKRDRLYKTENLEFPKSISVKELPE